MTATTRAGGAPGSSVTPAAAGAPCAAVPASASAAAACRAQGATKPLLSHAGLLPVCVQVVSSLPATV